VVRVEGLEPPAFGTGNQRSIQLSYTRATEVIVSFISLFAAVIGRLEVLFGLAEGGLQDLHYAFSVLAAHADPGDVGGCTAGAALHEVHHHAVLINYDIDDIRE
jgi:hypothetical protein